MVETIESALNPFSLASFIFGFGILKHPYDHPKFRLSILYMLIVWSVYAYTFHFVMTSYSPDKSEFNGYIATSMSQLLINLLVTMTSIIIIVRKYEKFNMCIKKLGLVDDTLEKLGTSKEYRKIRNSVKWILVMWFIIICITCTADSVSCVIMYNDTNAVIVPMVMGYSLHINTFMDIRFMFLLRYIGTRLDQINDHIGQLSETKGYGQRKKYYVIPHHYVRSADNRKLVLWTAMHLHSELCRIARNLNGLFGIQITVEVISYFIVLIGMFYMQYYIICLEQMHSSHKHGWNFFISTEIWCTIYIIRFISLNFICESVSAKVEKTKDFVHKLTNLISFSRIRKEICQFIMQISLQPLKFNGIGLFYFGYNYIQKFFAWILTIVIFMVQMDSFRIMVYETNNATYYDVFTNRKKIWKF